MAWLTDSLVAQRGLMYIYFTVPNMGKPVGIKNNFIRHTLTLVNWLVQGLRKMVFYSKVLIFLWGNTTNPFC